MSVVTFQLCYFPLGLNDIDVDGEWLVQRQVLWRVPQNIVERFQSKSAKEAREKRDSEKKRQAWNLLPEDDERGEVGHL